MDEKTSVAKVIDFINEFGDKLADKANDIENDQVSNPLFVLSNVANMLARTIHENFEQTLTEQELQREINKDNDPRRNDEKYQ